MTNVASTTTVFVSSIVKTPAGITVEASNGSETGPPFVRFSLLPAFAAECRIGKRYTMTLASEEF